MHFMCEVDAYWATVFQCSPEDLWRPGVVVSGHGEHLANYRGVLLFRRLDACRASAPSDLVEPLEKVLRGRAVSDVFRRAAVLELLGERVEKVIGPNWYGYVERARFQTATGPACREVTDADASALTVLRDACADGEWAEASFEGAPALFGCFDDRRLVAASNLTGWRMGHDRVGVVTHPEMRGRGYGAAVASAATERALQTTPAVEWRARGTNAGSINVALKLGFALYGENLAIRLR